MKKRFLSGLLAAAMTIGLVLSAFPAIIANAATQLPLETYNITEVFKEDITAYLEAKGLDLEDRTGILETENLKIENPNGFGTGITTVFAKDGGKNGDRPFGMEWGAHGSNQQIYTASKASNSSSNDGTVTKYFNPVGGIAIESHYARTITFTFKVPTNGIYNIVPATTGDGTNKAFTRGDTSGAGLNDDGKWYDSETETIYARILVNGAVKETIALAEGETKDFTAINSLELAAGDTIAVQTSRVEGFDGNDNFINGRYSIFFDLDVELMEEVEVAEKTSWNIGDEMVAGVEAYFEANGSTDMSGSPLFNGAANIPYFGAFKYTAQVYANNTYNTTINRIYTQDNGIIRINSYTTNDQVQLYPSDSTQTKRGLHIRKTAGEAMSLYFKAPKTGVYKIVPLSTSADGTASSFVYNNGQTSERTTTLTITAAGETLSETTYTVAAGGTTSYDFPAIENISLDAEEEIIFKFSGDKYGNSFYTVNFALELVEDSIPPEALETYNMADEIRNVVGALDFGDATYLHINKAMGEYAFGAFNLVSIQAKTGTEKTTLSEIENTSGKYTIYANQKNSGTQSYQTNWYNNPHFVVDAESAKFDGIAFNSKIWSENYDPAVSFTFTAPKAGIYTLASATAYTGKDGSIYNATNRDATITINVNGVDSSVAVAAKATGNLPELGEIRLNEGETVTFTIAMTVNTAAKEGAAASVYMNFDVNLVEDLTPVEPLETYNMADEIRNVVGALDFGDATYLHINKAMGEYAFGAFNLVSIQAKTGTEKTTLSEIENTSGKYTIYANQKNSGTQSYQTNWYNNPHFVVDAESAKFDGIAFNSKIWSENYDPAVSFTFTAPKAGIYTLASATAYTGKDGSIYNATNRDATITINVNGVDSSVAVAAKATGNLPELGEIRLNEGETVTFTIAMTVNTAAKEGAAASVYMNFDVNLVEDLTPVEEPKFAGASLNLKSDLTVSFTVKKTWFTENGYSDPMVRYEIGDKTLEVSEYTEVTSNSGEQRYSFALTGVGPQQMTDTITATLVATNAEGKRFAYETREYSVKTYCDNQLKRYTSGIVATLCVDILNYGGAMQEYLGYNTENLANADLTDAQKALATASRTYSEEARKVLDNTDKEATWKSASLFLDTSIAIDVAFVADDVTGYYVEFNDGTIVEEKDFTYNAENGRYYARYTNLTPAEMQKIVTAVIKNADGEVISGTVSYNVEAYVARNYNSENTALANACIALMAYGDSAYNYAN